VDYLGLAQELKEALAVYAESGGAPDRQVAAVRRRQLFFMLLCSANANSL